MATRYIAPPVALAQNPAPITREIRAQSFTLVDSSNHSIGTFLVEPVPGRSIATFSNPGQPNQAIVDLTPKRIVLRNAAGREIWSAGPDDHAEIHPLTLK